MAQTSLKWKPYALIALAVFLVYFKSLFFGYTYLDDNTLVLNNPRLFTGLSGALEAFKQDAFYITHGPTAYYRPILIISFMLDAAFGKTSPFAYHLTNILIHLVMSCLVFKLFTKLVYDRPKALFCGLIFSVHPLLSQAVSWIPGRNDSLMAMFGLAAFILFLKFLETSRIKYLLMHLIFLGLALFTKESAFALIIMCGLYMIIRGGSQAKVKLSPLFLILGWLIVAGSWFFLRQAALTSPLKLSSIEMLKSVIDNAVLIIPFIGKIIFPFNLSVLPVVRDATFGYGIIAIIFMGSALLISRHARGRFIIFGTVWFVLFLAPSFAWLNPLIAGDYVLEHRIYMPMVGFLILAFETDAVKKLNFNLRKDFSLAGIIVAGLAVITIFHTTNFRDRLSFWKNAVQHSPHSPLAHNNLGAMYYLDGQLDKAQIEYEKALELHPAEAMTHNNLGLIHAARGEFKEAEEEYKKELEMNPGYDDANFNLGLLYEKMGEKEKAVELWKKTLELNPDYAGAKQKLEEYAK